MHLGWILISGLSLLSMAVVPRLVRDRPMSLPVIYLVFGWLAFTLVDPLRGPRPITGGMDNSIVLYGSEIVVIVSLATVGLSIERRPGLVAWASVWRLLLITMPLCILGAMVLGQTLLALTPAAGLLLGAVLAPTDPVLADDVQVSAPGQDHDCDEVRFTLTAEAGLNDSLAFPFTHLAIAAAAVGFADSWGDWLAIDVAYRLVVGVIVGVVMGWLLTRMARRWREAISSSGGVGVFILGATLAVYGITELVEGYGFLAVFIAALSRHDDIDDLRVDLHGFAEQFESMLVAIALIAIGGGIAEGLLSATTPRVALLAAALILIVRPLAGLIGLMGASVAGRERAAVAFLGIRGVGSVYYLAYATASGGWSDPTLATIWATVVLTIVGSAVVHGVSAPLIMRRLD